MNLRNFNPLFVIEILNESLFEGLLVFGIFSIFINLYFSKDLQLFFIVIKPIFIILVNRSEEHTSELQSH